jgi:hypothetical protein
MGRNSASVLDQKASASVAIYSKIILMKSAKAKLSLTAPHANVKPSVLYLDVQKSLVCGTYPEEKASMSTHGARVVSANTLMKIIKL